jgi:hypothetical protein
MGGLPPYSVSTADAKVKIISQGGNVFQIWGKAPGTANVNISDSAGGKKTAKLNILASQMKVSHPLGSEFVGSTGKFTVTGGLVAPPIQVVSSVNNVTISPKGTYYFNIKAERPGSTHTQAMTIFPCNHAIIVRHFGFLPVPDARSR